MDRNDLMQLTARVAISVLTKFPWLRMSISFPPSNSGGRIFSMFRKAQIALASTRKSQYIVYFIPAGVFSQHVLVLVSPACFERMASI